jgi:MFS family permease
MFVLAYAFLVTYQAYYLLDKIGTAKADVPQQIFLGTLTQSAVLVAASLLGGKLSDRTGRRKIFVLTASIVYGLALFVIAIASHFSGFLVGMAISGLGFGVYAAVDLALVVDVLPDKRNAAKDLGVFNIAGALPFSIAPAIASAILAIGHGGSSYSVLLYGRRTVRHHRRRGHPARAAGPMSTGTAGPPLEGPAVSPTVRRWRRGRRATCWSRPLRR